MKTKSQLIILTVLGLLFTAGVALSGSALSQAGGQLPAPADMSTQANIQLQQTHINAARSQAKAGAKHHPASPTQPAPTASCIYACHLVFHNCVVNQCNDHHRGEDYSKCVNTCHTHWDNCTHKNCGIYYKDHS